MGLGLDTENGDDGDDNDDGGGSQSHHEPCLSVEGLGLRVAVLQIDLRRRGDLQEI